MTFRLNIMAKELADAISICAQFADLSSKVPILKAARISVADGVASFAATNTMQTIIVTAPCEGEGTACIDAGFLLPKARALIAAEPVSIQGDAKSVTISQRKAKWKVPVYLDDWPLTCAAPVATDPVQIGADFISALAAVRGGVRKSEMAHAYDGAWTDGAFAVAVDGRQMRIVQHSSDLPKSVFAPDSADKILSLFKKGGEFRIDKARAQINHDNLTMIARLMEAQPMDWQGGIHKFRNAVKASCVVSGQDFTQALKRAAAIGSSAETSGSFINMQIGFRADRIEIMTRNAAGEEGQDEIAVSHDGPDADVGVNGAFVLDALSTLSGDVRISHGENRDALILEPAQTAIENCRIIFPRAFT